MLEFARGFLEASAPQMAMEGPVSRIVATRRRLRTFHQVLQIRDERVFELLSVCIDIHEY
jgi:hypothetical protein